MNSNDLVSQMLAATTAQRNTLAQSSTVLNEYGSAMQSSQNAIQALGTQYVEQAAAAAKQKAGAEYARQVVGQQAQEQLGLNPDDVQNEIARSMATINTVQQDKAAALQEWQSAQQVDFMKNPIGYVLAQFKANDAAQRYNAAEAVEIDSYKNIQNRTATLGQIKTTVVANTADALLQANLDAADAAAVESKVKYEQAKADSTSKQAGIWMQQADLQFKAAGLVKDDIRFIRESQNFAEMRQERAEARTLRAEQMNELRRNKTMAEAAQAEQRQRLAALSDFVGRTGQLTPETLKQIKNPKQVTAIVTAADTLTMGSTLAEGVKFVAEIGDPTRIKQTNPGVYKFVLGAATSLKSRSDQLTKTVDPKTGKAPKESEAALKAGDSYQDELEKSVSNSKATKPINHPTWDTEFNPYKAPYDVVADLPQLQNNVVAKTVKQIFSTKQEPNFTGADETLVFKTLAEQVKSGALTPPGAAAQVKQFYDTAAAAGLQLYQYDRFNLPVPSEYYMQVPIPALSAIPFTSGTEPVAVNLRNVSSVERALVRYATGTQNFATPENIFRSIGPRIANMLRGYELPAK